MVSKESMIAYTLQRRQASKHKSDFLPHSTLYNIFSSSFKKIIRWILFFIYFWIGESCFSLWLQDLWHTNLLNHLRLHVNITIVFTTMEWCFQVFQRYNAHWTWIWFKSFKTIDCYMILDNMLESKMFSFLFKKKTT